MESLSKSERRGRKVLVTMPCRLGLHLRTAALFIHFANKFESEIRIRKNETIVDGKSILGLLALGVSRNEKLCIEIEGKDAELAIKMIKAYFGNQKNCVDGFFE
jgi:phosphocarrier protein